MLNLSALSRSAPRSNQSGVTLVITLIVLVAMTLATITLMRSVDTTNIIAGNLAFQQASTHAADSGTEDAVRTSPTLGLLPTLLTNLQLNCIPPSCPAGYMSWRDPSKEPPATGVTWESWWAYITTKITPIKLGTDALGNTVSYVIESECDSAGQTGLCLKAISKAGDCSGNAMSNAAQVCIAPIRLYYRVTSRVQGPRNTVSYVQTILAM